MIIVKVGYKIYHILNMFCYNAIMNNLHQQQLVAKWLPEQKKLEKHAV